MYQYQPPKSRFENKLKAMTDRAKLWGEDPQISQWTGLKHLLEEFSLFAEDYIGLLDQTPPTVSNRSFVLSTGLERLLQEWNILSRACEQRLIPAGRATGNGVTPAESFPAKLAHAEKILADYCLRWRVNQAIQKPYLEVKTPVVYFEKLYRISRSIYAPEIPVISIPLTDFSDNLRWQALTHEFGHHLYWNVLNLKETPLVHARLQQAITLALAPSSQTELTPARLMGWNNRVRLWGQWLEETFADICGTLFDGPAYVFSAQDFAMDRVNIISDLTVSDEEHPCHYLRPQIALETLNQMIKSTSDVNIANVLAGKGGLLSKLERRWRNFTQKADNLPHTETGLTMAELAEDIPAIIQVILYGQVWPAMGGAFKTLWELVDAYGQQAPTPEVVKALEQLSGLLSQENYGEIRSRGKQVPKNDTQVVPPLPTNIRSAALQQAVEHLKDKVTNEPELSNLEEREKLLGIWSLLLNLELSETKTYHVHGCTDDHWHFFFWGRHWHPSDGSGINSC